MSENTKKEKANFKDVKNTFKGMTENIKACEFDIDEEDFKKISALTFWGKLGKRPESVPF